MFPWIILAFLVLVALAAPRYGVDSRDTHDRDWRTVVPVDPPG